MYQSTTRQTSASNSGVGVTDCTRYSANTTVTAIGCMRHLKALGAGKFVFTFMMTIADGTITSYTSGVVHFYNADKIQLPDEDENGTVTIIIGKMAFMDPESLSFTIPVDKDDRIYSNLSLYDFFMDAEKVFPLTSAGSPPTTFSAFQPPIIAFGGVASNCVRTKPASFTCDIELFMSSAKKLKPHFAVKCIFSSNGPYKNSTSPPAPWNKRYVMVTGSIVSIEYDRTRTRANGSPIVTRYVVEALTTG